MYFGEAYRNTNHTELRPHHSGFSHMNKCIILYVDMRGDEKTTFYIREDTMAFFFLCVCEI